MIAFLESILFYIGDRPFNVGQALLPFGLGIVFFYLHYLLKKNLFPHLTLENELARVLLARRILVMFIIGFLLATVLCLNLDYTFKFRHGLHLSISLTLKGLLVIAFVGILDWMFNYFFIDRYLRNQDGDINVHKLPIAKRTVNYCFYTFVFIYILKNFGLDFELLKRANKPLMFSMLFEALLVLLLATLAIWVIKRVFLSKVYQSKHLDSGSQFAINQLVKYVVYIFSFVISLHVLGIDMTLVLGGAAALLVGIGLGLQQTFNDFFSGIVLLFERSVSVGDVLEFDSTIGTVKRIGLRSSIVETRDNISLVVPNHLLVNNTVMNWTHFVNIVRFNVGVGVAYGSDTTLVKNLLLEAAHKNPDVYDNPKPFIRFASFGDSSLDFQLYFFSSGNTIIEDIKSELRFEIDALFRENGVTIPFPQRDVHVKKDL